MTTISQGPRSVTDAVAGLDIRSQAFVDGAYVDAVSGETFDCVSPITGEVVAQVAAADSADVDRAVAGARAAFESGAWSRLAPKKRKRVLQKLAGLMSEHAEELALLETIDMGKPIRDATNVDVPLAIECIAWYGEAIDKVYDEIAPTGPDAHVSIVREPLGVVGAVVPWNFPLLMSSWKLGPALATGNSVILKPAEQSPLTALRLVELASEAGIPDGVLQVVPGFGETAGQALGRHPDVDMIAFTGSTEVGKLFLRYSGESNMKRVALECGGKSPHIVTKECGDLDAAATAVAWGVFYNQGEVCNAGSRLLVHSAVKDELLEKVVKIADRIAPGDPLDPKTRMGAIVDETQLTRVLGYIESGVNEGAGLHLGGSRVREDTGGYYVEPTIFDAVSNDMTIAREEIFGPVLSAISFDELDDAITIANDTIYGLSAGIWTDDVNVAHRAARAIRAGIVWVNTFDAGDISSPFGGFKQSGFGRDKSIHALEKFTDLKAIWIALRD
jgi:4-guanidinobutyraldehyde dehydrogenase / NAD-dependent aldehyde dehydrogenase